MIIRHILVAVLRRKATPLTLRQIRTPEAQRLFDDMIDIMRREQVNQAQSGSAPHGQSQYLYWAAQRQRKTPFAIIMCLFFR